MSDISAATPRAAAGDIAADVQARFALPEGAVKVQRATRLWIDVDQDGFGSLFEHLYKDWGFIALCTITGVDLGAELGFIYHLARDGGIVASVRTRCPKGAAIRSVTPYFPAAVYYERELVDLLGARVEGLPPGARYPLPDNWPDGEHPLLKDWTPKAAATAEQGEAKNE
jgi:Ni,Fe-hydrogenase III component G